MKKSAISLLIFSAIFMISQPPDLLAYNTLISRHFYVHYPEDLNKVTAVDVAEWAEGAYETLRQIYPGEVRPVHIQIHNKIDDANGDASSYLFNKINVFLFQAPYDSEFGFKNWIQSLLIHELTHIFTMDDSRGYSTVLKWIFGYPPLPFTTPNMALPMWFHEGLTVFNESIYARAGRLNTAKYDMYYRKNVLFGDFPHISKSDTYWSSDVYPYSGTPYLYGAGIFWAVYNMCGRKNPTGDISNIHAGRFYWWVNYGAGTLLKDRLKDGGEISYEEIYAIFQNMETERQKDNLKRIRGKKASSPEEVYRSADPVVAMTCDPEGEAVYLYVRNISGQSGIYSFDYKNRKTKLLFREYDIGERLTLDAAGRYLYFNCYAKYNMRLYAVPCRYDLLLNRSEELECGRRFLDLCPSPGGEAVAGLRTDNQGKKHLEIFYFNKKNAARLWEDTQAIHPLFVEGNSLVVFLYSYQTNRTQFIKINCASKERTVLAETPGRVFTPHYSNGRIYFSGDSSGVFNLYYYDINEKRTAILSNLETGGFYPVPAGNKILFLYYDRDGYSLSSIQSGTGEEYSDIPSIDTERIQADEYKKKTVAVFEEKKYTALSYLRPYGWMPFYAGGSGRSYLGAYTIWRDPLYLHYVDLTALYDFTHRDYIYLADYTYLDEEGLTAELSFQKSLTVYNAEIILPGGGHEYHQSDFTNSLYAGYAADTYHFTLSARGGALCRYWRSFNGDAVPGFYEGALYGPSADLIFSNRDFYLKSLRPQDGVYVKMYYNYFIKPDMREFGADIFLSRGGMLAGNDIITLKNFYRIASKEKTRQSFYSSVEQPLFYNELNPVLRGYDDGYLAGYCLLSGNLEYSFPLIYIFTGWGTKPLFLRGIYINGFFDYAGASLKGYRDLKINKFVYSSGCELGIASLMFYHLQVDFTIGYARAYETGDNRVYFKASIPLGEKLPSYIEKIKNTYHIPREQQL